MIRRLYLVSRRSYKVCRLSKGEKSSVLDDWSDALDSHTFLVKPEPLQLVERVSREITLPAMGTNHHWNMLNHQDAFAPAETSCNPLGHGPFLTTTIANHNYLLQ